MIELLGRLPAADDAARAAVARRAQEVLRPAGALARLDEVAAWLAAWQRTPEPAVRSPGVIVFVGDHGVTSEGVSAYPRSVTQSMLVALRQDAATASVLAREVGATIDVVDTGVGVPTGNLRSDPALTRERFSECWALGREAVDGFGGDLLVLGEMGIGNTTSAAAVCCALFGLPAEDWTGRGTGIDETTLARKTRVIADAVARVGDESPLEILRQLGGTELVALASAVVEARRRSLPVVLDGFVVTAAAAPLELARNGALDHCLAGHCSSEPGHRLLLDKLDKPPLLDLDLRLGEGSGALFAVPLVRMAAACVTDVATLTEWGIDRPT